MDQRPGILIVGGYGVFGARLARRLLADGEVRVLVAGRSLRRAQAFCSELGGGEPMAFDRDRDPVAALRQLAPFVVVDAAGPFQNYGADPYRLARAALEAACHYLDLSDDADFTGGITALDAQARAVTRVAISGASSVPGISAAAVRELAQGLRSIELIDTVILPGNRAPRGLSVMRAILAQAGRPLALWRDRQWTNASGWGGLRRDTLEIPGTKLAPRWSSLIGAPDLRLFPARFGARSVVFRAGLELTILHLGLSFLAGLVRWRLLRDLPGHSKLLLWIADRFLSLGSDRGGMRVSVAGRDTQGTATRRCWTLIADAGAGPNVPAISASLLIGKLRRGEIAVGARACLDEFTLAEVEQAMQALPIRCARSQCPAPVLYERVLGAEGWRLLPEPLRRLHDVHDFASFAGEARIVTGRNLLARVLRICMGFPPGAECVPVRVSIERRGETERWIRQFGRHRFSSDMSAAPNRPGCVIERFGALRFRARLPVDETGLAMPLESASFFHIPLPRWLVPRSDTRESVDEQGRFRFDVDVSLPLLGRVIRYTGWLVAEAADTQAIAASAIFATP